MDTQKLAQKICDELLIDIRRRLFDENMPRIRQCLSELSEEEVWQQPNENSNSVGNLLLHLTGNMRQYILTGIDQQADVRKRQQEFDTNGSISKAQLLMSLETVMVEVNHILDNIQPEHLIVKKPVQCFEETIISILVHVTEHFSYHVGQITYFTKAIHNKDLRYYGDLPLDETT